MKILCIIDCLGSGGAQKQLVSLAKFFKDSNHEVSFLVYYSDDFYKDYLLMNNINIIEVVEKNYIKRLLKMRHIIRNGNYDAVLSFLEAPSFIAEIATLPTKKWQLIVGERSANPKILTSFKLKFYRWFHFLADAIVANSYENIKIIKKVNPLLKNNKLHVVYNLMDFEKWKPKRDKYIYRKDGKFNLIVVASHQYLKNLNGLIEAINLLDKNYKNQLRVNWYGGPSHDDSKIQALKKIDNYKLNEIFRFYDPTLDIATRVNEADALGLFSFYEGLPNVVCEAMINAKAIISSNISDISLLINQDLTFDANSIGDIADKLVKLLEMKEEQLLSIGYENHLKALSKFNSKEIKNTYIKILEGSNKK